jgi:CHASE2 domain-containing sensor protein
VVIHANILSMLLDRDYIHDVRNHWIYFFSLLLFLANYLLFSGIHHLDMFRSLPYIRLVQIVQFFLILAMCLSLLLHANVKMGFTFMATCVILSYEFYEAYENKMKAKMDALFEDALRWVQRGSLISKS